MSRTLLLDADLLAYKASAATQRSYQWDGPDGPTSVAAHMDLAQEAAEGAINSLIDRLKPDELIVCLSDDFSSFRRDRIASSYKSKRVGSDRPVHLYDIKDWLRSEYVTEERTALEADDVMGILATDPSRTDERIIVSADKDMMTVPGKLYRPQGQTDAKGRVSKKPVILDISPLEAMRFHFYQTVVGDTTDGYGGAPGIGPKSPFIEAILQAEDEVEAWQEVILAFESRGLTEADAIVQARLARILQFQDYDGRSPILWLPPWWEDEVDEDL